MIHQYSRVPVSQQGPLHFNEKKGRLLDKINKDGMLLVET